MLVLTLLTFKDYQKALVLISKCNYVSLNYPCFGEKLIVKGFTLIITLYQPITNNVKI